MPVNRRLMLEQARFFGAVRYCHDVHVFEFRSAFAPIAMGKNVIPPPFAPRLDLPTRRDGKMKQRVKTRDPHPGLRRFNVLEKGGEAPDDFARSQVRSEEHTSELQSRF